MIYTRFAYQLDEYVLKQNLLRSQVKVTYHVAEGECLLGIHSNSLRVVVHDFGFLSGCFGAHFHQAIECGASIRDAVENRAICSFRLLHGECEHAWQVTHMGDVCHLNAWCRNTNRPSPDNPCKVPPNTIRNFWPQSNQFTGTEKKQKKQKKGI